MASSSSSEERIRVVVRLRPVSEGSSSMGYRIEGGGLVVGEKLRFGVDRVYHESATQSEVFEGEGVGLIEACVEGRPGLLLAYGQTGSGKTHTILGEGGASSARGYDRRGLVPRALERLFGAAAKRRRAGASIDIGLSCLEVYNEQLVDLLSPSSRGLAISEVGGSVSVKGLTVASAASATEALQLLYEAEINRAVGRHALNLASSRSHLVVTAHVATVGADEDVVRRSKVHFVDLAGSERVKLTDGTGATLREASYINKSLSFLEQVVVALSERPRRDHVPFRSSKLTHLLKDALGSCRASLVACLWPHAAHLDQSLATLRFAARMGKVETALGERQPPLKARLATAKLKREVDALRRELALRDLIGGAAPAYSYAHLSPAELADQRRTVDAFLADADNEPPIQSVAQVRAVYAALRDAALAQRADSPADDDRPRGPGPDELRAELAHAKLLAAEGKQRVKRAAADVNNAKKAIDALLLKLEATPVGADDLRGPLVARLNDVKAEYRSAFGDLEQAKTEFHRANARKRHLTQLVVRDLRRAGGGDEAPS